MYAGKAGSDLSTNDHGLGYNVVMKLTEPLLNEGYQIYFDNFYTSSVLVKALHLNGTPSCGTVTENRKGFPKSMKGGRFGHANEIVVKCDGCGKKMSWLSNGSTTRLLQCYPQ